MPTVWSRFPDARLVLAGASVPGAPTDLTAALDENARTKVEVLVDIDDERREELLASSGVFVSASTRESFGLVLIEAMSAGLPVVCPDTPVNREVTGGNAVFCRTDAEDLGDLVADLLADPGEGARLSAVGRAHVGDRYTWTRVGQVFLSAYRKAVES